MIVKGDVCWHCRAYVLNGEEVGGTLNLPYYIGLLYITLFSVNNTFCSNCRNLYFTFVAVLSKYFIGMITLLLLLLLPVQRCWQRRGVYWRCVWCHLSCTKHKQSSSVTRKYARCRPWWIYWKTRLTSCKGRPKWNWSIWQKTARVCIVFIFLFVLLSLCEFYCHGFLMHHHVLGCISTDDVVNESGDWLRYCSVKCATIYGDIPRHWSWLGTGHSNDILITDDSCKFSNNED